jgi:hypothetical protein
MTFGLFNLPATPLDADHQGGVAVGGIYGC